MTQVELSAYSSVSGIRKELSKLNEINWEARRYEVAKAVLPAIIAQQDKFTTTNSQIEATIELTDTLLDVLKQG